MRTRKNPREKKQKELEELMKGSNSGGAPDIFCIKIAETCEIAPIKEHPIFSASRLP